MDDQHGVLLDTLNELRIALIRGASQEEISMELARLLDFTCQHFSCEEQLMEQNHYPEYAAHRLAHEHLMAEIQSAVQKVQHYERLEMRELITFLRRWLIHHIEKVDEKYGKWLNERGVH